MDKSMVPIANGILGALMVRAVGHTYLMRTGTDRSNQCRVVVISARSGDDIAPKKYVTLDDCADKLRGTRLPIAIDNMALERLLRGLLGEIDDLKKKINLHPPDVPV